MEANPVFRIELLDYVKREAVAGFLQYNIVCMCAVTRCIGIYSEMLAQFYSATEYKIAQYLCNKGSITCL